jgi:hypothetical protein
MKRTYLRPAMALAAALFTLLCFPRLSAAKAAFSAKEGKPCAFCHVGKTSDVKFTKAGEFYSGKHTLAGFAEGTSEAKPAAGKPAMMEGMKKHMEEVRKSVAALRAHEKTMEGITDPAEFRKAAIEHFRMQDDLQESHVKHMESMMGGGGPGHRHSGQGCQEPCKDCPNK